VSELCEAANRRSDQDDLTEANVQAALEQISCEPVRHVLQEQLSKGKAHYQEEYLLKEMTRTFSSQAGEQAGIVVGESEGMIVSDPTAIRALVTLGAILSSISKPLQLVCFLMVLYHHGVALSVLGRWCQVNKSTVLRWILGLALQLWPIVSGWIQQKVKTTKVYVDEKWLKIQGKWYYWFVVMGVETELPILTSLLASRGKWACRWIGCKLKKLGQAPNVIITDGMAAYRYLKEALGEGAKRLLRHFHHQQSTSRWVKEHIKEKAELIKQKLKKILQTGDKRTVKRRFERLKAIAEILGIQEWINYNEKILPKLLLAIGSKKFPKTTNAIERFFRNFNQFYKGRRGFFSVVSAKRELICFLVMYLVRFQ
ncbi:DDE-type integrase/transposase/recombinase, partial [bacterium]|nr:DDE-type integrase/transposase/recombinase [bacterium]